MRCAKLIAPASFGALLQLPKEQLRDIIDKQPSLKSGLREYVMKKSGNKSRTSALLELFAEDETQPQPTSTPATPENGSPAPITSDSTPAPDAMVQDGSNTENSIPTVDAAA